MTFGFSTGALALSDFRAGLAACRAAGLRAVELSALREAELPALAGALRNLDLSAFDHVSVHAPGRISPGGEGRVVDLLAVAAGLGLPIVVHPDVVADAAAWRQFGPLLLVENMDKRKPAGRTADELDREFGRLPEAGLCLDLAHARQVDPTMTVASSILRRHGGRVRQLHLSEVDSASRHGPLTRASVEAFRRVAASIPAGAPVILESVVNADAGSIRAEVALARRALAPPRDRIAPAA